jgi:acetylornithine/succinyldiaminopimelate/putrescine aminotransferase
MATKRKRLTIAGRHLWQVNLRNAGFHLWITTRCNSLTEATEKAVKFVRRHHRSREITSITNNGTIDA